MWKTILLGAVTGLLAACGEPSDSPNDPPIDSPPVLQPTCFFASNPNADVVCDFSCQAAPWPTTAPDPLTVQGVVYPSGGGTFLQGAQVEVRSMAGDALLGSATTIAGGRFEMAVATGGVAPVLYRKAAFAGYLDAYSIDAVPVSDQVRAMGGIGMSTPDQLAALYQRLGLTVDPAAGTVTVPVLDCGGNPVRNAVVEAPTAVSVAYTGSDGFPDRQLTATGNVPTAIVFGAPAGELDITVRAGDVTYRPWPTKVVANATTGAVRLP
jgi:hypothetical protein